MRIHAGEWINVQIPDCEYSYRLRTYKRSKRQAKRAFSAGTTPISLATRHLFVVLASLLSELSPSIYIPLNL